MHLSGVGFAHTVIGLVGVVAGIYMLIRYKKIRPETTAGLIYFATITVSSLLVFALHRKTPGFNPGHAFTVLTLLAVFVGSLIRFAKPFRARAYIETLALSASLFFTFIPTINETLTRIPVGAPLASGPQDPLVLKSLGVLTLVFFTLCVFQIIKLRKDSRTRVQTVAV